METTLQTSQRHRSPVSLAAMAWAVVVIGMVLFIHRAIGCRLAGCTSANIALVAALTLAFGLGGVMTYADHKRERELHH